MQRGVLGISTDIARQDINIYCGDVEFSLFGIVDYEELILLVVDLQPLKPSESPDPVFQMNDRVTGMKFCDRPDDRFGILASSSLSSVYPLSVKLGLYDDLKERFGGNKPPVENRGDYRGGIWRGVQESVPAFDGRWIQVMSGEKFDQRLDSPGCLRA